MFLRWLFGAGLLSLLGCAAGSETRAGVPRVLRTTTPASMPATAPLAEPPGELACRVEAPGQGCRALFTERSCGAFLSLSESERGELQGSRFLDLRWAGDHRAFVGKAARVPRQAHRALVTSGVAVDAIAMLTQLLGGPGASSLEWPDDDVVQFVAYSMVYGGAAFRLRPATLQRLAAVQDVEGLAARWDRATREYLPRVESQAASTRQCVALLSEIVAIARDADRTGRDMYVVSVQADYRPACSKLGGCGGYGCEQADPGRYQGPWVCHGPADDCLQALDCSAHQVCQYSEASARFSCQQRPRALQD